MKEFNESSVGLVVSWRAVRIVLQASRLLDAIPQWHDITNLMLERRQKKT